MLGLGLRLELPVVGGPRSEVGDRRLEERRSVEVAVEVEVTVPTFFGSKGTESNVDTEASSMLHALRRLER